MDALSTYMDLVKELEAENKALRAGALDLLQARLEKGGHIECQDGEWWLFNDRGEGICSGESIREMLGGRALE